VVTKLDLPEQSSVELLKQIIAERSKGVNAKFFAKIGDEWTERVQAFIDAAGNPELIKKWDESIANPKPFLTLYNSPAEGHAHQIVLSAMREKKLQICPSCGEDGTPYTLDHYLPKTDFPHFSVIPANLSPMCDICQGHKLAETLDEHDRRIFIHPYFDQFVANRVLRLVIGKPYESPHNFELLPMDGLSPDLEALLLRHVTGLQLQPRFVHFVKDMHGHLVRTVANIRALDQNVVHQIRTFRRLEAGRGKNGWRHIYFASVLKDDDLLEWLENGKLPEYIDTVPDNEDEDEDTAAG